MNNHAYKVVCFDDGDPFKFSVVEDVNVGNIEDVCRWLRQSFEQNDVKSCKWLILPITKK